MKHILITTIAAVLLVGCNNDVEVDISKIIEERHANIDSTSSIQNAAKKGDIEAVKKHLASGVDVNDDGGIGMTALQNAAAFGHSDIVQLLINNGADVNPRNPFNLTPLDQASMLNFTETIEIIREHGGKTGEELMATEQPVASDLRLSTSILQASLHLERLGDLSVYLGKTTHEIHDLPIPESLHKIVVEMGDMVIDMASSALESLKNRDPELALSTARKDELINSLYNKMLKEVPNISGNKDLYSGLFRLITCVRTLERGGDHAVDICELASFLVTGEFKEF